ncbi:cell division activator CedA, partial [Pseudomonas aeruginosa]|uniref:cell division activator CedA n=1 Tax=Pseudomonas aeruginosa TaxID=287 RepID=UPI0031B6F4AD
HHRERPAGSHHPAAQQPGYDAATPPEHAIKMDSFRDVWMLRGKYVAFVLMGESFLRSPAFTVPESAQRWANQIRQENEVEE